MKNLDIKMATKIFKMFEHVAEVYVANDGYLTLATNFKQAHVPIDIGYKPNIIGFKRTEMA